MSDFFDQVKQWEFERDDRRIKLPVFYYDNTTINAIFTGATRRVKPLLPHPAMRPIELYPGRCLVAVTAFEYRKTDIDPYNEVAISFPISFGRRPIPGLSAIKQMMARHFSTFVWQLPVTTEIARVGGVQLYGYPKFLAEIDFELTGDSIRCDLAEKGDKILSLEGKVIRTGRGRMTKVTSYTMLDGIPLKAMVLQNPIEFGQSRARGAARLELGDHPISTAVRDLELSEQPVVYQFSPVNEAILFPGRNLVDE